MRGRPVMDWVLFSLLWLLLLWPILEVTRARSGRGAVPSVTEEAAQAWITLRFSVSPGAFAIRQQDRELWSGSGDGARLFESEIPLAVDDYGTEFLLEADLPPGESVVEVVVEADGRARQSRTLWIEGPCRETVSFSWGGQ